MSSRPVVHPQTNDRRGPRRIRLKDQDTRTVDGLRVLVVKRAPFGSVPQPPTHSPVTMQQYDAASRDARQVAGREIAEAMQTSGVATVEDALRLSTQVIAIRSLYIDIARYTAMGADKLRQLAAQRAKQQQKAE